MLLLKRFKTVIKHTKIKFSTENKPKTVSLQPKYLRLCPQLSGDDDLIKSITVHENFLTEEEEKSLFDEVEKDLSRMRYQFDHWDNAIHGYRETEKFRWNPKNKGVIERVKKVAFAPDSKHLKLVHVLDLNRDGYIKPHVDSVRFCGDTIAGLSLLTDSVMRLTRETDPERLVDILLKRRSLYVLTGPARYDYKHEILRNEFSSFGEAKVFKDRRISIICRNEPNPEHTA